MKIIVAGYGEVVMINVIFKNKQSLCSFNIFGKLSLINE